MNYLCISDLVDIVGRRKKERRKGKRKEKGKQKKKREKST